MRYMFERRVGMHKMGDARKIGGGSGAAATPKTEKEKETSTANIQHPEGPVYVNHPEQQDQGDSPDSEFAITGPSLSDVERTTRGSGAQPDLLQQIDEYNQELPTVGDLARRGAASSGNIFDETQATKWKLGTEFRMSPGRDGAETPVPVPSLKGSGQEGVLEFNERGDFAYLGSTEKEKPKGKDKKKDTKKSEPEKKPVRQLNDKDVLGYIRGSFDGFDNMSEEQQRLFWEHIQSKGGADSLARLNFVEALRRNGSQPDSSDMYGRRREPQGVLPKDYAHFDPSNPDNRTAFFTRKLNDTKLSQEDREKAEKAFEGRDPAKQKEIMQMDPRDALRELEVETHAATQEEQAEDLKNKDLIPRGKETYAAAETAVTDGRRDISTRSKSPDVQAQMESADRLRAARAWQTRLDDLSDPKKKDDPKNVELAGVLSSAGEIGGDGKKMSFDISPYKTDLDAARNKFDQSVDSMDPQQKQIAQARWDDFERAISFGRTENNENGLGMLNAAAALEDLVPGTGAADLRSKISRDDYFSDDQKKSHEKKTVVYQKLQEIGVPDSVLSRFSEGTLSDTSEDFQKNAKLAVDAEEKIQKDLEDKTHFERDLKAQVQREQDFEDLTDALYNGEPTKATRLARDITGDKKLKFDRSDYTDDGLGRVDKRRKAQRDGQQANVNDSFKSVQDILNKPGEVLGVASKFIGDVNTGIGAIHGISEALNLKLSKEEAGALRDSVKYDALFGETGAGRRGFKRSELFGSESKFAKYEKKEPAEGSAAKNLATLATPKESGRARLLDIKTKDAQIAQTQANTFKTRAEGGATDEKESASAGKKRRYKVHKDYGGGIPV